MSTTPNQPSQAAQPGLLDRFRRSYGWQTATAGILALGLGVMGTVGYMRNSASTPTTSPAPTATATPTPSPTPTTTATPTPTPSPTPSTTPTTPQVRESIEDLMKLTNGERLQTQMTREYLASLGRTQLATDFYDPAQDLFVARVDEANNGFGQELLFARHDGVFTVYELSMGNKRLIAKKYEAPLKSPQGKPLKVIDRLGVIEQVKRRATTPKRTPDLNRGMDRAYFRYTLEDQDLDDKLEARITYTPKKWSEGSDKTYELKFKDGKPLLTEVGYGIPEGKAKPIPPVATIPPVRTPVVVPAPTLPPRQPPRAQRLPPARALAQPSSKPANSACNYAVKMPINEIVNGQELNMEVVAMPYMSLVPQGNRDKFVSNFTVESLEGFLKAHPGAAAERVRAQYKDLVPGVNYGQIVIYGEYPQAGRIPKNTDIQLLLSKEGLKHLLKKKSDPCADEMLKSGPGPYVITRFSFK